MAVQTPQAVQDCHELLVWLIGQIDQFPRVRRFTLGERLESAVLELLELLVDAAYARSKHEQLARANRRVEIIRHLWRAAYELKVVPLKRYEHGARLLDGLGRQVGGWRKSIAAPR